MEDIDFDILAVFGLIMSILELIFAWLWAHTTTMIEVKTYNPFMLLYAFPITMVAIFVILLARKRK